MVDQSILLGDDDLEISSTLWSYLVQKGYDELSVFNEMDMLIMASGPLPDCSFIKVNVVRSKV